MKTIICLICAAIATSALASHPQSNLSGATYEVEIVRNNGSATKGCMTFHESGRLTMPEDSLTMLWSTQIDFANRFMAVTAPGERTVVPYHRGVYGEVFSDNTLKGRGIDKSGSTFAFVGKVNDDCVASRLDPVARAANSSPSNSIRLLDPCQMADGSWTPCDPVPNPLRNLVPILDDPIRIPDPCQMEDGSWTHCDPVPDPLRDNVHNVTPATLAGRSFWLTLGTSNRNVLEYCWTFTQKHQIETANQAVLTWSPDSSTSYDVSFISTGAGGHGQGMAYQGSLVGNDLLEVVGIEARDGKSFVTYGFGQEVASCLWATSQ